MADRKQNVFETETVVLLQVQSVAENTAIPLSELQTEYANLAKSYETLLGDTKVLINISDRLKDPTALLLRPLDTPVEGYLMYNALRKLKT